MAWATTTTEGFAKEFRKYQKSKQFVDALDRKLKRLRDDPEHVGGMLSGRLHGYRSTRILKNFRLIFKTVPEQMTVYLVAIDHRKFDYDNFDPE